MVLKSEKENTRIQITVSQADLALLTKWGEFHGRSPAEFASQIIASRVEANLDLILRLEETAKQLKEQGKDS